MLANSLLAELAGMVRLWVALLVMIPVGYGINKYVYETGDGWIKILGRPGFARKAIAILAVAIGIPIVSIFAGEIRNFLLSNLPTGMWLLPFVGIGILGVIWVVNDAANMNILDGQRATQTIILLSVMLIVLPFLVEYITTTYNLGLIWEQTVVRPITEGIINPIKTNWPVLILMIIVVGYGYFKHHHNAG